MEEGSVPLKLSKGVSTISLDDKTKVCYHHEICQHRHCSIGRIPWRSRFALNYFWCLSTVVRWQNWTSNWMPKGWHYFGLFKYFILGVLSASGDLLLCILWVTTWYVWLPVTIFNLSSLLLAQQAKLFLDIFKITGTNDILVSCRRTSIFLIC